MSEPSDGRQLADLERHSHSDDRPERADEDAREAIDREAARHCCQPDGCGQRGEPDAATVTLGPRVRTCIRHQWRSLAHRDAGFDFVAFSGLWSLPCGSALSVTLAGPTIPLRPERARRILGTYLGARLLFRRCAGEARYVVRRGLGINHVYPLQDVRLINPLPRIFGRASISG